jgi:hypothetical protein
MPGKNPPRKTKIRGQRHMLAYITPDEAALLKARGGTGELHKGIPSYPPDRQSGDGANVGPDRGGGGGDKGFDSGYTPVGDFAGKELAEKKLDEQIAKGKKNISQMTGLEQLMAALAPGAGFEAAQNIAAQYMGGRMKDVLSQQGSRAVIDPRTGRVEGVYDAAGRLTGRDTKRDRARSAAADARGGGDRDRPFRSIASAPEDEEEKRKTVIRSDLAKEVERQRRRNRRTGATGLGSRSLLSNVSRLGA